MKYKISYFLKYKLNKKVVTISSVVLVVAVVAIAFTYSRFNDSDELLITDAKARTVDATEVGYTTSYNSQVNTVYDAIQDLYTKLEQ